MRKFPVRRLFLRTPAIADFRVDGLCLRLTESRPRASRSMDMIGGIPVGRPGNPEEVAERLVFMCHSLAFPVDRNLSKSLI